MNFKGCLNLIVSNYFHYHLVFNLSFRQKGLPDILLTQQFFVLLPLFMIDYSLRMLLLLEFLLALFPLMLLLVHNAMIISLAFHIAHLILEKESSIHSFRGN